MAYEPARTQWYNRRWDHGPRGQNLRDGDYRTPPWRGQSGLHKHTFEAVGYVLEGRGYEVIGEERIDWEAGDTFFMPPNVPHRHVNQDPNKRARILQVEAWPLMIYLGVSELVQMEPAETTKPKDVDFLK